MDASPEAGAAMLVGNYAHSLDAKNRLIVPSKLRMALGERFIATVGIDKCLWFYPLDEWEKVGEKLRRAPETDPKGVDLQRFLAAYAVECVVDSQWRVLIPSALRDYAGIKKEVVFVGAIDKVEVWCKSIWEEYMGGVSTSEEIAQLRRRIGI